MRRRAARGMVVAAVLTFGVALVVPAVDAGPATVHTRSGASATPVRGREPLSDQVRVTGRRARAATGAQSLLFVPVTWPGNPPDSITTATATSVLDQVSQWYSTISLGALTFISTIKDWTTIAAPASTCDSADGAFTASVAQNATAALASEGVTVGSYDHVIYYMPATSAASQCSFLGLGDEPGNEVWISGFWASGYLSANGIEHELGHNLGLGHADTLTCTDAAQSAVPFSPTCESVEYGNPFDVMGGGVTSMFDAPHLAALGYLSTGQLATMTAPAQGTSTQTYDLQPLADLTSGGTRAIKVTTTEGNSYWVEFRAPQGLDSALPSGASGLKINLVDSGGYSGTLCSADQLADCAGDTFMINPTAGSSAPDQYSSLPAGTSWTDPTGSVTITAGPLSATGELVSVTLSAESGAPSAPSVQTTTPNHVRLSWSGGVGAFGGTPVDYQVLVSSNGAPFEPLLRTVTSTSASFSLNDVGVIAFEVVAVNAMGGGPASPPSETIYHGWLRAPQHLTAIVRGRTLVVQWQPPSAEASFVTQYTVTVVERGARTTRRVRATVVAPATSATLTLAVAHPGRLTISVAGQGALSSGQSAVKSLRY
jgi:hypothetical protein